jgi:YbbR domain-containing protein
MKVERKRRTAPPADDDAILDAAVEPARAQQQVNSSATTETHTPNGAAARVEGASTAATEVVAPEEVFTTGGAPLGDPPPGITTIVDTTTTPAAFGTRGGVWSRGLPAVELDERLGRLGLAVILAVLLWFYVVNLENPAQTTSFRDLPIDVRSTASNLRVISPLPTVDVTIQAPQNLMSNLSPADVHPYIDLSTMSEGVHEVPIRIETGGLPPESLTVNVEPREVQVQLQLQVTKVFSVAAQIEGTPPLGYKYDPAQVTPSNVQVTGSQDAIDRISKVVVPVNIDRQTTRVQGSRTPRAVDADGRDVANVTFEPANVQVLVPIEPYVRSKSVSVFPVVVGQPASGYRVASLTADPNNVQVCCSEEVLGPIDFLKVAPVSITGTTSTIVTTTQLILPPGVDLLPGQSRDVTITVQVEELQSTIELSVAPSVQGVPAGYATFVSPDRVDVTLQGSFNRLQQIAPADVRVVANVSGLGEGAHEVTLQTIVPDGVTLQRISTDQATVTLVAPTPVPPTATTQPSPTATSEPTAAPTSTLPAVAPPANSTATAGATATATQHPPTATRTPSATATPTASPTPTATATPQSPAAEDAVPATPLPPGTPAP